MLLDFRRQPLAYFQKQKTHILYYNEDNYPLSIQQLQLHSVNKKQINSLPFQLPPKNKHFSSKNKLRRKIIRHYIQFSIINLLNTFPKSQINPPIKQSQIPYLTRNCQSNFFIPNLNYHFIIYNQAIFTNYSSSNHHPSQLLHEPQSLHHHHKITTHLIQFHYFQLQFMEPPKSTVDNTNKWKLWHGFNYFLGGGTFLIGSLLLFPFFNNYLDAAEVSGWLYTIGSATFLLADITEWLHYVYSDCRYLSFAINFFINVCGSLLYLLGSACFIPKIGRFDDGMNLFIAGSLLIMIGQIWKLVKAFSQKNKYCIDIYKQDSNGFLLDLFALLGGLMYFSGTFVFKKSADSPVLVDVAAAIYSFGGLFFFTSSIYIQIRYFWEKSSAKMYMDPQGNSVVSNNDI